jgi:mannan endo-1,4-beta-mannosidase
MKLFYKSIFTAAALFAVCGLAACGDSKEDEPDNNTTTTTTSSSSSDLSVVSATNTQVLSDGYYDGTDIAVTFSDDVVLSNAEFITFDGSVMSVTPTISGKTATWHISLQSESSHTLVINRYAFTTASKKFLAKAYTYEFTTEAQPEVVSNFDALSNTSATKEAQNVYNYLVQQNGKKILSGAMANVNNNNDFADWINKLSGKYPALTCYDYIHQHYSGQNWINYTNITPAKTQWQNNGLVAYMWHWRVPKSQDDYINKNYSNYDYNASFDVNAALTAGTWQNECINADIAQIAGFLKLLQDENIPVLWRPLHEAAGDYSWGSWFWWGSKGVDATKKLWIYLHDKLTNEYGLNNLIWVWTAQTSDAGANASVDKIKAAYPGNDYVDIVGTDIYADDDASQVAIYRLLQQMTGGKKLITLSETGLVQNPDKCITDGAAWSYFMIWYTNDIHKTSATTDDFGNTQQSLKSVMNSSYVINRDQMPSLK